MKRGMDMKRPILLIFLFSLVPWRFMRKRLITKEKQYES